MISSDNNALRAVAKKCLAECKAASDGLKTVRERDEARIPVIKKYAESVKPKFNQTQIVYMMGVLNGRLRDPG